MRIVIVACLFALVGCGTGSGSGTASGSGTGSGTDSATRISITGSNQTLSYPAAHYRLSVVGNDNGLTFAQGSTFAVNASIVGDDNTVTLGTTTGQTFTFTGNNNTVRIPAGSTPPTIAGAGTGNLVVEYAPG